MKTSRIVCSFAFAAAAVAFLSPVGCTSTTYGFDAVDDGGLADAATVDATRPTEPGLGGEDPQDASRPTPTVDNRSDARPPSDAAASCSVERPGPGPIRRICLPPTANECDGSHDFPGFENGRQGNGFDDDCDGLVDEGCECPSAGATKECWLIPASQASNLTRKPVGWCESNSRGTMACEPNAEFRRWSGQCRGAQPPFADDTCAKGDFDCDGAELNSRAEDCSCKEDLVQCPTAPLVTAPFPQPQTLPLKVDAAAWMINPQLAAQATNFKWSMIGGDCDNILPHPTFGLYLTQDGRGEPAGRTAGNLGATGRERGTVVDGNGVGSVVYPAFSLSGDYLLQGEFDLMGKRYSCVQKVQVRAPGVRAEACWDTVGRVDLDLHFAKLNGFSRCAQQGWSETCQKQDCYFANCRGTEGASHPAWYGDSADSACIGWGSGAAGRCPNPRLDRDIVSCQTNQRSPNSSVFCAPENINVDAPAVGDEFAVSLKYYGGSVATKAHVNVYCNGERVIATGFDPVTGNNFPVLREAGANTTGDMWKVAQIKVTDVTSEGIACEVNPVPSRVPVLNQDGSTALCVDNEGRSPGSVRLMSPGGFRPLEPAAMCFH
jgi:hypothetical protein